MCYKNTLTGFWEFHFAGDENTFPEKYSAVMPVPGCFDLMEPYCGKRGFAFYRRKVNASGRVRLFIEAMGITGKIYWDGTPVGDYKYSYMPEAYVFDAGTAAEHELVIMIDNRYDEQFQGRYDFFGYGGIYGEVTIEQLPENYIDDIRISTTDHQTGKIRIQASAADNFTGKADVTVDGKHHFPGGFVNGSMDMEITVPEFKLWSPDAPNLHCLTVANESDSRTETFGIRTFATRGREILLNGKAIKFFGYNRHESHPELGAATPINVMARDLRMMKEQGCNFVRGCHYPQRRSFLELCDRMGIMVWEETMSWGQEPPLLHEERFMTAQREQAEKLTRASFNHPCIAIRGFLNENNSALEETRPLIKLLYDTIRGIDPHCLISYSSNRYEKDLCMDLVDVVSMNPYPGWYDSTFDEISTVHKVIPRLKAISDAIPADKPYLITEIGCEALLGFRDPLKVRWSEEYQAQVLLEVCNYVYSGDDCAGVAFWLFADTRSFVNGPSIYVRARGFNNKGVVDEYRRPKLAWDAITKFMETHKNR